MRRTGLRLTMSQLIVILLVAIQFVTDRQLLTANIVRQDGTVLKIFPQVRVEHRVLSTVLLAQPVQRGEVVAIDRRVQIAVDQMLLHVEVDQLFATLQMRSTGGEVLVGRRTDQLLHAELLVHAHRLERLRLAFVQFAAELAVSSALAQAAGRTFTPTDQSGEQFAVLALRLSLVVDRLGHRRCRVVEVEQLRQFSIVVDLVVLVEFVRLILQLLFLVAVLSKLLVVHGGHLVQQIERVEQMVLVVQLTARIVELRQDSSGHLITTDLRVILEIDRVRTALQLRMYALLAVLRVVVVRRSNAVEASSRHDRDAQIVFVRRIAGRSLKEFW